jgi:hypothetical protein
VALLGGSENAIKLKSIFKPSGFTWRLGKCDQIKEHFQAKWFYLAARKMRSKKLRAYPVNEDEREAF